ncbi:methyltransferase MtaB domain-containing protein [Methanonatronarchaeum sp. AMET-Sl]|uniref:methyltransferase MtaB domain-containing protein n=1 Tax=Methanonatronarchaeum sp. AMET-Sl TaxID=3037654 RepID=UPI00244DE32E|nr:methyltransferase MtaB domain-containing protein [Methanonatronarchaeum sp. AMET-Sl]WGI17757.1 methyltransferase MtaB domain-containing protein [Methanonatronarchaeum sp. AMET-Sl]
MSKYTEMAYDDPEEMIFGEAKEPVTYGHGPQITAGGGQVFGVTKIAPRPGAEARPEKLKTEFRKITKTILQRAVTLGFPTQEIENEWVHQMGENPVEYAQGPAIQNQAAIAEEFAEEHGIATATTHTIPDLRVSEKGLRHGQDRESFYPEKVIGSFEIAAENGADVLKIESSGGMELADYGIQRGDIKAFLFGIGYLGSIDMEWLWSQIVDIAEKNNVVPGGDTNCPAANTAMFIAGGYLDQDIARTFSAITRAICAGRTIVAWEQGATGPDKDCGYEGPIVKAIAGKPIVMEGKDCSVAHADLMGNLAAQVCDGWSNESAEFHEEFSGWSSGTWAEAVGYEVSLMNTAKELGEDKTLRDIYMASDRYRSPESFITAYDNAYKIGEAMVEEGDSYYRRSKAAALKAAELIEEANEKGELQLSSHEKDTLDTIVTDLRALPEEEDKFVEECLNEYGDLPKFDPKNYGL